jgi:Sugar phosphate isomerases/epimerases
MACKTQKWIRNKLAVTAAENAAPKAPILFRGEMGKSLRDAKAIGYEALEVHVPDIWKFDAAALAKSCRTAGMGIASLVSGQLNVRMGLSLSHDDPDNVAKAVEGLKRFVDAAAVTESGVVVGWVRGQLGDKPEERLAQQGRALQEVDKLAAAKNVPLFIEAINRYELDSLNNARQILDFIEKYELTQAFVHLDTFHMNLEEYSPSKAIRQCGEKLGYIHLADNTRWYPGHDRLDFDEVFSALAEIGYPGYVAVECLPYPDGTEAARQAYAYLSHRYFY